MEVEKNKILQHFWLHTETNNKNLVIGRIIFSKSDKFGPFFSWKILPLHLNHIFQVRIL
jgi:hypothetical protein